MSSPAVTSKAVAPLGDVVPASRTAAVASDRLLTFAFALALFASASLVFIVEPMFAKLVLPRLGGTPAVWNTCMVFYQAVLLAGYAYAHLLTTRCSLRRQVFVHASLLLAAGLTLPVSVSGSWTPPVDRSPIPSLLATLLSGVGAPLFVLSATAPLLQRWFSRSGARSAGDPYFLYVASNVGSILALLAYPLLIEPLSSLSTQARQWSGGFTGLAALTILCGYWAQRADVAPPDGARRAPSATLPVTWSRRARWVGLSLVPSSLMLAVTTYISTDIASVPLLWTVPLALYLLSFILGFSTWRLVPRGLLASASLTLLLVLTLVLAIGVRSPVSVLLPLHLAALFVLALALHTELADDRPDAAALTDFYLWISVGGVTGGLLNTLVAPLVFTNVVEYPLAVIAAAWLMVKRPASPRRMALVAAGLACGTGAAVVMYLMRVQAPPIALAVPMVVLIVGYLFASRWGLALATGVAVTMLAGAWIRPGDGELLYAGRTFFGLVRVWNVPEHGQRRLSHGTTFHGAQSTVPGQESQPLSYYHPTGPIGRLFTTYAPQLTGARIGVVGLGAGGLAAYRQPAQRWTFYEIDPEVARIARDERYFTYLAYCGQACTVKLGDARLTLSREKGPAYDLLIVDAFSSDAIPVHLMTREAMQVYLSRLTGDGILVFHISNRHLTLAGLVAALAAENHLTARLGRLAAGTPDLSVTASQWVAMARHPQRLEPLGSTEGWEPLASTGNVKTWTDDFSDILSVLSL